MIEPSLNQLEREVEASRTKLASDLSTLRSPATAAEFTETLKQEALDAKDALLDKAKASAQSSIESLIEDVKARAAANPAAALAIGAGIAWRLIRHPPIATALVGAGLISLFRTPPARPNGQAPADYLAHAKTRLREQASAAADVAQEKAAVLTRDGCREGDGNCRQDEGAGARLDRASKVGRNQYRSRYETAGNRHVERNHRCARAGGPIRTVRGFERCIPRKCRNGARLAADTGRGEQRGSA